MLVSRIIASLIVAVLLVLGISMCWFILLEVGIKEFLIYVAFAALMMLFIDGRRNKKNPYGK